MKTTLHAYRFDTREPDERAAYEALRETLRATPGRGEWMHSWGGAGHYLEWARKPVEVTLESDFIFDNQWNTAPIEGVSDKGYRVFDWAENYQRDGQEHIKAGHYLDITDEMREVRRNTHKCGYCGAHEPAAKGYVFCPHCIGSEYLKMSDLPLTRMMPAGERRKEFPPLSEAEKAHLLPLYREAQLHGHTERDKKRIAKARADVIAKASKKTANAARERDGFLWFMDRGIKTDNLIYYNHTGRFCFGWRSAVDDELRAALLDVVSEFPFPYDIKCSDGRTLSGG